MAAATETCGTIPPCIWEIDEDMETCEPFIDGEAANWLQATGVYQACELE